MDSTSDQFLKLAVHQDGLAAVVTVQGSAGIAEAQHMQSTLESLTDKQLPLIVLDLSGMTFICSVGLSAIISTHVRSRRHNGSIRLVNPQPSVRQLLELTNLTKVFSIYPDIEHAMAG